MRTLVLVAALLSGCADPYEDTKKIDTVEAWESYVATKPTGSKLLFAEDRIEELMTKKAEESKKVEDYDAVLKRFPKSKDLKKLQDARVQIALAEAQKANTEEAWKKFETENPFADPALIKQSRTRAEMAAYTPNLSFSEPIVKQVNLAENPKGPLDGWGFEADVTNNGDRTLSRLNVEVQLLDANGAVLRAFQYPAVASSLPGGLPIPEGFDKPMAPKDTRHWAYTTGDIPEGWSQKVKVVPVSVAFAKE